MFSDYVVWFIYLKNLFMKSLQAKRTLLQLIEIDANEIRSLLSIENKHSS